MVQELTSRSTTARISAEEARLLYEDMVLGRLFEDKCAEMYYKARCSALCICTTAKRPSLRG
jgi:pyruvate dehydrogenase E1 component alpha subunit